MIRGVLFDLGETLISFEQADIFAAFDQAARNTYDLLEREFNVALPPFGAYRNRQLWALRWAYFKSKLTGREFNSVDVLKACYRKLNISVPEAFYDELAWQWYRPLAEQAHVESDAAETLTELQRRELTLAIVSNTFIPGEALDRQLTEEDLIGYFPVRVYSCNVGIRKPNPQIFLHALKVVGVPAGQAVFVGDKFKVDVAGARRAGMFAVQKSLQPDTDGRDPKTFHIYRLAQLPGLIDQINETFRP